MVHDRHAFAHVVHTVTAHLGAQPVGIGFLANNPQLSGRIIEFGLHISKAVDTRDNQRGVLAQAVQDNAQRRPANLIRHFRDFDGAFGRRERLVSGLERKASGFFTQQAGREVAVTDAHLTVVGHRAGDAKCLQPFADGLGSFGSRLAALFDGDGRTYDISPFRILETDGLGLLAHLIGVDAYGFA